MGGKLRPPGVPITVPAAESGEKPDIPALSESLTVDVAIAPAPEPMPVPQEPQQSDPAVDPTADPAVCAPEKSYPPEPIDPGIVLQQTSYYVDFETLASTGLEGIVQAVCPDLDRIVVSADDLRETGQDLTLALPDDVDPSEVQAGDSISTNVDPTPGEDGALELTGLAGDDGAKDADDEKLAQGDKEA